MAPKLTNTIWRVCENLVMVKTIVNKKHIFFKERARFSIGWKNLGSQDENLGRSLAGGWGFDMGPASRGGVQGCPRDSYGLVGA